MNAVAVLFARSDSNYFALPGCDVFDVARDARTYAGTLPVVAHPPCRSWGRLRQFAKPRDDEKQLGPFAVQQVRRTGGVLEHPAWSTLWGACGMPAPGFGCDAFGGWTLGICQKDFGHRALKPTWLYIVGVSPLDLPPFPLTLGRPTHVIRPSRNGEGALICTKSEREHTPQQLAVWLVAVAASARGVRHG